MLYRSLCQSGSAKGCNVDLSVSLGSAKGCNVDLSVSLGSANICRPNYCFVNDAGWRLMANHGVRTYDFSVFSSSAASW